MTESERCEVLKKRQETISAVVSKYSTPPQEDADEYFMSAALELATAGVEFEEVPVGCVIVRDGRIIAADFNGRESLKEATYHAESAAITEACRVLGGWRLPGCTMYVTLEPCPMCAGAVWCARIPKVVIGARDLRAGAFGTLIDLNSYPLNHKPGLVFGVLEEECRRAMQDFFAARRGKNKNI